MSTVTLLTLITALYRSLFYPLSEFINNHKISENITQITAYDFQPINVEFPNQFALNNKDYMKYKSRLVIVPHHKLLYCNIAKNANTMFRNLFWALMKNDPKMSFIDDNPHNRTFIKQMNSKRNNSLFLYIDKHNDEYTNILQDASWNKLVIIRDPLERLLSGYLNKCFVKHTKDCVGGKTDNFTEFAERILYDTLHNQGRGLNHHFFPQHLYCDLYKSYQYYNHVILYQYDSIGNDTLRFLQNINLTQYYYHWGLSHNETMFSVSAHTTFNTSQNVNDIYKKYYKTKKFASRVIKMYYNDYVLFNLSIPKWFYHLD